ncbi:phosphatidylglycerol/phosphatidylinositol transfer protein [Canna indica]|uniref:Phosphatidylglycerol/phosphatidylinositol transfer protein n=1 Tax=Canna indica TaxID=4628 RepID=A0AAQ3L5H3_9LILI|nr:phosphatidylglycerol/phosphatidylinositol transfer protein [Canna indica]
MMASIVGRRLLFSASVLLILLLPLLSAATDVEYCKKGADYPVKVSGIEISPYPVARGKPATFNISANTGDKISKGKLVIDVKYFGFHVHKETHDLCEETSCPVATGDFILSHQQTLPSFTPPGSYTLTMNLNGENGQQLTCIIFDFSIGVVSVADN